MIDPTLDHLTSFFTSRASRAFGQLLASLLIKLYLECGWIQGTYPRLGITLGWFYVQYRQCRIYTKKLWQGKKSYNHEVYVQRNEVYEWWRKYPSTGWRTSELWIEVTENPSARRTSWTKSKTSSCFSSMASSDHSAWDTIGWSREKW